MTTVLCTEPLRADTFGISAKQQPRASAESNHQPAAVNGSSIAVLWNFVRKGIVYSGIVLLWKNGLFIHQIWPKYEVRWECGDIWLTGWILILARFSMVAVDEQILISLDESGPSGLIQIRTRLAPEGDIQMCPTLACSVQNSSIGLGKLLPVPVSTVSFLGSGSCGTHDHIYVSHYSGSCAITQSAVWFWFRVMCA
jgi:hypothetical protein